MTPETSSQKMSASGPTLRHSQSSLSRQWNKSLKFYLHFVRLEYYRLQKKLHQSSNPKSSFWDSEPRQPDSECMTRTIIKLTAPHKATWRRKSTTTQIPKNRRPLASCVLHRGLQISLQRAKFKRTTARSTANRHSLKSNASYLKV